MCNESWPFCSLIIILYLLSFSDLFQRRREESSRLQEEGNEQFKKGGKMCFSALMLAVLTHSFVESVKKH